MTSAQFWALSLKELWLERRYARQKQRDERDRDVILAWQITRIRVKTDNDKRMPDLESLLTPKPMDQLSILQHHVAKHGLTIKRVHVANSGVTVTGLRELEQAIQQLPETMTAALKAHAKATADRILDGYRQRLLSQTKAHKTAASARVLDESDEKQFTVNVPGHPDDPANLSMWLEYGTRHMVAKPSLRPAGDEQNDRYKAEMAAIAERTMREAIE